MAYPDVQASLAARITEFDEIPADRKQLLHAVSKRVARQMANGKPVRLTFICTHNSRRSHLSQIWAAIAAEHYEIADVATYSGGTEATAFNPRAVAALQRSGLKIEVAEADKNPRYAVRWKDTDQPLICFSKVYSQPPNPNADYFAVMTCSQADEACPVIPGASQRFALPYVDPKVADGTPDEASTYDERSRQICREMLYLFSQVKAAEK